MGIYKAGKPFTLLQEGAIDSSTKLLIHSNTSNGSTTFVDSSTSGHTITPTNANHATTEKKFGETSIYFDGTGDYLSVPDSNDWNFDSGDFTIDLWVKHTDHAGTEGYMFQYEGGGNANYMQFFHSHGSGLRFFFDTPSSGYAVDTGHGGEITDTNWHHIAIVKFGTKYTIYKDGINVKSVISSTTPPTYSGALIIGDSYGTGDFDGYMDEIRISKVARWTENFPPPSSPYSTFSTFNIDSVGDDISNKDIHFPSNPSEDPTDVAFGVSSNVGAPLLDVYAGGNVGIGVAGIPTNKFEVHTGEPSGSKFSISSGNDSYTKLLIHSDTVSGSTTFIDSSANNHVISVTNNVTHSIDQKKFGDTSMYFGSSEGYLSIPDSSDWDLGDGDWTWDAWIYAIQSGSNNLGVWSHYQNDNNRYQVYIDGNGLFGVYSSYGSTVLYPGGSNSQLRDTTSVTYNTWEHWAIVCERDGSTGGRHYLYRNGGMVNTENAAATQTGSAANLLIGHRGDGGNFKGYIDEFRISKGIARWTTNFTPATRPYSHELTVDGPRGKLYTVTDSMETHGSGSIFSVNTTDGIPVIETKDDYTTHLRGSLSLREPFTTPDTTVYETKIYTKKDTKPDSFTTLLLHSDTTDGSTDFLDSSVGHNISGSGDTHHSTVQSKIGASSMYFDGTGDYLSLPNSDDFTFGPGDFTIDFWKRFTVLESGNPGIFDMYTNNSETTTYRLAIVVNDAYNGLDIFVNASWRISAVDMSLATNIWYHFALVKNGSTTTLYKDGVSAATYGTNYEVRNGPIMIGRWSSSSDITGYIDELRVSKGIARWTGAFTPPTEPYETDEYTKLLIHSDTRNRDTYFLDSSETISTRKVITTSGDPSHEDTTAKFGATSIYLDGSDYLDIASHADFNMGTGDFTMDGWFNFSTIADNRGIMSIGTAINASGTFGMRWSGTGLQVKGNGSTLTNLGGITNHNMSTGQWHHLALQRRGGVTELFVDGILLGSDFTSYTLTQHNVRLGHYYESPYFGVQYIDEFRLSKGIARWTSNFDPPTRRYPLNEDKLLIKSDDGIEKTVIAAEPYGVATHGQVLKSTGEDGVQWGYTGITDADHWRLHTSFAGDAQPITSNLERVDYPHGGHVMGVGMSESSGVFTFPSTGYWLIIYAGTNNTDTAAARTEYQIQTTIDNSSYTTGTVGLAYCGATGGLQTGISSYIFNVADVTQCKVRFGVSHENTGNDTLGSSTISHTYMNFIRLGDV